MWLRKLIVKMKKRSAQSGKSKKCESFILFAKNWPERRLGRYYIDKLLNWMMCYPIRATLLAFPSLLYRQDSKKPVAFRKIRYWNFVSSITPQKQLWRPKLWNKINDDCVLVLIQKVEKSDQEMPRKLGLKRWNAEGCYGRKNGTVLTGFVQIKKTIGAKVLNTRHAKTLSFLNTLLTTSSCNATDH